MSEDSLELDVKLERIRNQITSKLENQKNLAVILSVVEDNIKEQENSLTPTAYFVSFLALLDQSFKDEEIIDENLATSTFYFLDVVFPFVPKGLLRSRFGDILIKLAPALTSETSQAALIRSCIGALEALLIAQDSDAWKSKLNVSPWRALEALLDLSLDPRPKIRKRAQESIHNILDNPPPSPNLGHIAGDSCSEFALKSIIDLLNTQDKKKPNKELNSKLIHNLQLIQTIGAANAWSSSKINTLCDVLLDISKTNDQYLVSSAFSVFEHLFNSLADPIYETKFNTILDTLFDLKPSINDSQLVGSWAAVIAKAIETYSKINTFTCLSKLPEISKKLISYLASDIKSIYVSAANCLISIVNTSIPDQVLLLPPGTAEFPISREQYELVDETIEKISEIITELLSVKYSHCAKEVMDILNNLLNKLRYRSNPDLVKPFEIVGQWRTDEEATSTLDLKEEEDTVIANAIINLGADVVLSSLPLNLDRPTNSKPGRAWLLPLLRDNVRNSSLGYYINNILPLVEYFSKKVDSPEVSAVTAKVFQTVIDQIWSLLPHFCDLPTDLQSSFNVSFAENLSNILYSNVELRTTICHALKLVVESNLTYSQGVLEDDILMTQQFPIIKAQENIKYLSKNFAENMISVLFNVYSQTNPDSRGYILETIDVWLQIADASILEENFNKVCTMLKEALEDDKKRNKFQASNHNSGKKAPRLSVTMMDLVVAMVKYVPETSYDVLFTIFNLTNGIPDSLIQKRSYRILTKLSEIEIGVSALKKFISEIEQVIISSSEKVLVSSKASRLIAIEKIIDILPNDHLYFIPSIASEIILSTKDVNEKTRELSYTLLIKMGKLMNEGGILENGKVPGLDPETPSVQANLSEFFTIVSAGLGGESPHMISASITALSCLVYEFLNELPKEFLQEISSTIDLFLTSNNREIVKSTIGFVKVEVLSLPIEVITPKLKELLEYLLRWSNEHKGHFKLKVKHIVERMIRRFGYEAIEANTPENDKKLLINIKKTRQRNKKKAAAAGEADEETPKTGKKFTSAYDEVLYESSDEEEAEAENDDDDVEMKSSGKKSKQYIIENKDAPLDLLDKQALAHISSTRPGFQNNKSKQPLSNKFKSKDGKFVFNEEGNVQQEDDDLLKSRDNSINAYVDAVKQGPIRGQRNRLKYKRGRTNVEDNDGFSDDEKEKKKSVKTKFVAKNSGKVGKGGSKNFRKRNRK